MKVLLAFIFSWFKGLGHTCAITESKADAMQSVFGELGKDEKESRDLAKTLLIEVHGYSNLVPIQMQARASSMARKIRKRNWKIRLNNEQIARLQAFIDGDKNAVADFDARKIAALAKKENWS